MKQNLRKKEANTLLNLITDLNFADLRSDEEKQTQREAFKRVSLGPEVDPLVEELTEIGQIHNFISGPGGNFNENGQHIRTREIGDILDRMGGIELMQAAYYRILVSLGLNSARALEWAWGNIGEWLP
ncbi:MAG: hypothetical protein HXS44_03405 [Theionarchaea archaeon]|nr:hypothetical protein [Theionarchaea archaeon]